MPSRNETRPAAAARATSRQNCKALVPAACAALLVSVIASRANAASSVELLQEFDMEQVRVTDPYYQNLFAKDLAYLLSLDADRLLAGFKAVSQGVDPLNNSSVNVYGGWEGAWSQIRGHTLGHYLSALAQAYKQTKGGDQANNAAVAAKLDYMIKQLASFQASNGYLFASPESHFDNLQNGVSTNVWVPWYTMHKILAGIVDVAKYTGNATALQVASKLGDWTYKRASAWNAATRSRVLGVEYGGMNDCLYELYKLTNNANHLAAAHIFDEDTLFTPVSKGTDTLNGVHANTTIPKFIGALNRYRTLGASENFYYTAAQQFWTMVVKDHTYVTGGNSQDEHFRAAGQLNSTRDNLNNETCNAYNMLKLSRDLFKVSGDVKYANFYERAHLNEVMSAMNPTTGMTTYFKPMGTGYFKVFGSATGTFWCCNGTGMENYTKLNDALYFHTENELYVNQYISSTLDWSAKWLTLSQTASVPLSSKITFSISAAPTSALAIKFRKPYWLAPGQPVSVTVNGQCTTVTEASGYLSINRTWAAGDTIVLNFPADVQVSRLPDAKNAVAFSYGPVVLSASLGTEQMVPAAHAATQMATLPAGVSVRSSIAVNTGTTIEDWIRNIKSNLVQTPGKLEFSLKNTDADSALKFTPQYQRYQDRYGIYFTLTGTQGTASSAGGAPSTGTGGYCSAGAGGTGAGGTSAAGGSAAGGPSPNGGTASGAGTMNAGGGAMGGATTPSGGSSVAGGSVAGASSPGASSGGAATIAGGGANGGSANGGSASGGTLNGAGGVNAHTGGSSSIPNAGAGAAGASSGCSCATVPDGARSRGLTLLASAMAFAAARRSRRRQSLYSRAP